MIDDIEGGADLHDFSLLKLEQKLSLIPWLAVFACWLVLAAVLLLLRHLQGDPEMNQVINWLLPGSFLVMVPGLGSFVTLLLRMRRARIDISFLHELRERLGGEIYNSTFTRPMVRPRLLTLVDDIPVEVLLSPPIPRTARPLALDPQRAAAQAMIEATEETMESPQSRLGTATWPQIEVRIGVDLPFCLQLSNSPHLGRIASRLHEVELTGWNAVEHLRILSDEPARAAALLADRRLRTSLVDITFFNAPWATQFILRPAAAGRGAGAYLLSVASDETSAEDLGKAIRLILEACSDPAW